MVDELNIQIIETHSMTKGEKDAVLWLCRRAYEEDIQDLFETFVDPIHVLGYAGEQLVSHAMWVTRYLEPGKGKPLHTAYVELVATAPEFQGRGYSTMVMKRLANSIDTYDVGCLCPAKESLYARLGWVFWRGPLFIRKGETLIPTPDERVMILRLPNTPPLNLDDALIAEWRPGEVW